MRITKNVIEYYGIKRNGKFSNEASVFFFVCVLLLFKKSDLKLYMLKKKSVCTPTSYHDKQFTRLKLYEEQVYCLLL